MTDQLDLFTSLGRDTEAEDAGEASAPLKAQSRPSSQITGPLPGTTFEDLFPQPKDAA